MFFESELLESTGARSWNTAESMMGIVKRKGKRCTHTNQHEASLVNVCVGKTPLFTAFVTAAAKTTENTYTA